MTHTEIAFANERAIIADMLINLLTNVRLTYLPDLEPGEAQELLLTGAHILIAQLGSQPPTAAEISSVIGRPLDVVTQRLDELIARGYVEHRANRYEMTANSTCRTCSDRCEATLSRRYWGDSVAKLIWVCRWAGPWIFCRSLIPPRIKGAAASTHTSSRLTLRVRWARHREQRWAASE